MKIILALILYFVGIFIITFIGILFSVLSLKILSKFIEFFVNILEKIVGD